MIILELELVVWQTVNWEKKINNAYQHHIHVFKINLWVFTKEYSKKKKINLWVGLILPNLILFGVILVFYVLVLGYFRLFTKEYSKNQRILLYLYERVME